MPAERGARLLADNRQNRLVIHARVIQARQQVRSAWAGSCDAHAKFTGELGVCTGHECGHFLMACLHELDLALSPPQGTEHPVDTVARVAKNTPHTPLVQTLHQKVTYCAAHHVPLGVIDRGLD